MSRITLTLVMTIALFVAVAAASRAAEARPNLSTAVAAISSRSHVRSDAMLRDIPPSSSGPTCQDYADPVYAGEIPLPGMTMRSTVAGDIGYVGCFDAGLRIVNLPEGKVIASVPNSRGETYGSILIGDHLVVATYTTTALGLRVLKVGDPAAPILENTLGPTDCSFFSLSGRYLYVASCFDGVSVFDTAQLPDLPLVAQIPCQDEALGLVVRGGLLYFLDSYMTTSYSHLRVYDVSDPAHARELGAASVGGYAIGLTLAGNFAYVASFWGSTQVFDVSNSSHPSWVRSLGDSDGFDIARVGTKLYVASLAAGMAVYDLYPNGGADFAGRLLPFSDGLVYGVTLAGNYAYPANGPAGLGIALQACQLRRVMVSTDGSDDQGDGTRFAPFRTIARAVEEAGDTDSVIALPGIYRETIDPKGKKILIGSRYVVEPDTTLISATVIDGERARRCAQFTSGEDSSTVLCGLTLENGFAAVGAGVRIGAGAQPTLRQVRIHGCLATDTGGGIACGEAGPLAAGATGIRLEDAALERNASPTGGAIALSPGATARLDRVVLRGNWAGSGAGVALGAGARLEARWSEVSLNQAARGAAIHQGGAAATCLLDHVTVAANVAGDTGGAALTAGPGGAITLTSGILWGDLPYEASVPATEPAGSLAIDASDVQDGMARLLGPVAWGTANISADPLFCDAAAGRFPLTRGSPCEHAGEGGTAMGGWSVFCSATSVDVPPRKARLGAPFPNPFNPVVTLPLVTDRAGRVRLGVYDARGRQVALLWDGDLPAGAHALVWRGTDDRGRPAPSGIYFGRLQAGGDAWTRRLVLAR